MYQMFLLQYGSGGSGQAKSGERFWSHVKIASKTVRQDEIPSQGREDNCWLASGANVEI